MKISVITVAYNSAATIADTLRSVATQTHPDIEHIVIDGASTDDTLTVVKAHGKHVQVLVSEPDRGIYDAMNKGLALASGEFVGFLNADDLFASKDSVKLIVAAAESTACDAVYGDLAYVRADDVNTVVRLWRGGDFRRSRLRFGWMPPHPTFYVRREFLSRLGAFDSRMRVAADYELMMRCLVQVAVRTSYVPQLLVRMRLGGASNASIRALVRKSREDLHVMRRHRIGGWFTLICKNLRKLPQFIVPAQVEQRN